MATKTRSSFVATMVGVVIVAAAAMSMGDGWGDKDTPVRNDTDEYIVLTVRFTPSPSHRGIHIIANVDGHEIINYLGSRSPWEHAQWIPKGAEVSMTAQQSTPDMVMCQITSNAKLVSSNVMKDREGSARCWHNRRTR
jgi:hypothetical protein